ncbi:unnamed protein product, partial [Hymenolepis diminuta]
MGGAANRFLNRITSQVFYADPKSKQRHFINAKSQTRRLHTKHSVMNSIEIINQDAISECFSQFREMRVRGERLDVFIDTEEGGEVGAHLIVLSAFFPVFRKHLSGNDIVRVRLPRFSLDVVSAAVEYAYGGIDDISLETAVRLYLLAHNLKNKCLVDVCTKFLCNRIEETNLNEVWFAANATKNEVLIGKCAHLVAIKWEMFATSRLFHENTEIEGMMSLFGCPEMAKESGVSTVMALLDWRDASRDGTTHTARTNAFTDIFPLLRIQDAPKLITDLFVLGINIPDEWRWCLAHGRKTAKGEPIVSSSMPSTSTGPEGQTSVSTERLAILARQNNALRLWVYNTECSKVDVKLKIPDKGYTKIFAFQSEL